MAMRHPSRAKTPLKFPINLTRRDFLTICGAAAGAFSLRRGFAQPARGAATGSPPLETFTQWLAASRQARQAALQPTLDRIADLDRSIHAWRQVQPQPRTGDGPLAEIPFGVKDIIETKGLSTEYGSAIYQGRIGTEDAAIVRLMRARGGILLGKTHTTAFAYREPSPARNPRNLEHTPGGSSSGSAAAVAAGMVPVAIGTQTRGSVLRPASFCGVTGFKTTYGLLPMEGVLPYARSFDTLGFFTHTAADMLAFWGAMGQPTGQTEDFAFAAPDPLPDVEPEMRAAFAATLERLRRAGLAIRRVDLAGLLVALDAATSVVAFYEGAISRSALQGVWRAHGPDGRAGARWVADPRGEIRGSAAHHRRRPGAGDGNLQVDAGHPRAGGAGTRPERAEYHGRSPDEFSLDGGGDPRDFDPDADQRGTPARAATHRRSRRGCARHPGGGTVGEDADGQGYGVTGFGLLL